MKNKTALIILLYLFCLNHLFGQEKANNGIEYNTTSFPVIISNPSFEAMNCCPSTFSQMNCATDWIQASGATADYLNTCGYVGGAATGAGLLPFPNGDGVVGVIFIPNWQEYIGSCLLSPMLTGQSYTIQMDISSTPISGNGGVCNGGNIYYGPIDIVIYGSISCGNLPFSGSDCPPAASWQELGTANYTPVPSWGVITITFAPTVDINAIIIGSPCTLPTDYVTGPTGLNCNPYFYIDNLILSSTSSIDQVVTLQNQLSVSPNPFYSEITIKLENENVAIIKSTVKNILGEIIFSDQSLKMEKVYSKNFYLDNLADGFYFLEVEFDGNKITKKLVKD